MDNYVLVLESWYKEISIYEKLTLSDAKILYNYMINCNVKDKEIIREKLITGMLYLIPNFISKSLFPYIRGNNYDMNDIINSCNEELINVIDSGKLLEISYYTELFNDDFYCNVVSRLSGRSYNMYEEFGSNFAILYGLMAWYINESMKDNTPSYDMALDYTEYLYKKMEEKKIPVTKFKDFKKVYNTIVNVYNTLKNNGFIRTRVSERQLELLMELLFNNIEDNVSVDINTLIEDDYSNKYMKDEIEREVLELVFSDDRVKDRDKELLKYRYGIIDGEYKTLVDSGKVFGLSKAGASAVEKRTIGKVKKKVMPLVEDYFDC